MTRKISKEERQRRKFNWAVNRLTNQFEKMSVTARESVDAFTRIGVALGNKPPTYNWPEPPERSRMHSEYARKKGRS